MMRKPNFPYLVNEREVVEVVAVKKMMVVKVAGSVQAEGENGTSLAELEVSLSLWVITLPTYYPGYWRM